MISLPFCDTAGPLSDNKDIEQQLIAEALTLGKEIGVNEIELRTSRSEFMFEKDTLPIDTYSHKVRMFLDLHDDSEKLLKSFKSKLRSQIKKPEKEGLRFEWGDINKLHDFHHVFSINMKDLGSPVHSRKWFRSVLEFYTDKVRMGMVYMGQRIVGCGIILIVNNTVTIPWASTLRKDNHLSSNMMLYWNFLAFASDSGYARIDFRRLIPNEGTYKFKAQWGAKPYPLHGHHIYVNKIKFIKKTNIHETRSAKMEIAANLWSKLPLCVANTLGARIRKYISL